MWYKILAGVLFLGVIAFTAVNTLLLDRYVGEVTEAVEGLDPSADNAGERADQIYQSFKKRATYMSLTVSHDDITDIEDCFVEMIGYISVGDTDGARVTKSRLLRSLEHLWRLSGLNWDSII